VPFAREGQRHLLAHFIDLTERHRATQELQQLAFHDSLTGLANRRLFFEHLRHAMERCRRSGEWGAVLMLDLNRFKQLNDQHGHEAGDHLLVEVARRITAGIRASDVVARLGGDEFTVLLHPLGSTAEQAHQHADVVRSKLQALLTQPYVLPGVTHHGSASIGCAWFDPLCSLDVEAVLRQA
ncbi:MAG: GGDEF domain-containing protein, partial [Janthinobacterium sp.]